MGDVALKADPAVMPADAASGAAAVLQMIERVALNPNADIDKLERLLTMRRDIEAQQAEQAFNAAMRAAQSEMGRIAADAKNSQTNSRYATYEKLDRVLRPIYTKHGFSLSFDEGDSDKPDHIRVLCRVAHDAGHTHIYRKDMPADGKGAKGGDVMTKTHAAGAAASYGARYLLKGIFNVAIGEEDKDGNDPTPPKTITEEQIMALRDLASSVDADEKRFCTFMRVDRLSDIPAARFNEAKTALERKRTK